MNLFLLLTLSAAICFFASLISLILGLWKKKRAYYLLAATLFVLFLTSTGYATYTTVSKLSSKVNRAMQPRKGDDIYFSLFGTGRAECVQVLRSQDQTVPRIDVGIFLHLKICPAEISRIVNNERLYKLDVASPINIKTSLAPDWFNPDLLGDGINVWRNESETSSNWKMLFTNKNMSEAFYADIAD